MSQETFDRKTKYRLANREKLAAAKREARRKVAEAAVYTPGTHFQTDAEKNAAQVEWDVRAKEAKQRGIREVKAQQQWMEDEERKMREANPQAWAENQIFMANQQVGARYRLAKLQETGHAMGIPDDELLALTPSALEARILGLDICYDKVAVEAAWKEGFQTAINETDRDGCCDIELDAEWLASVTRKRLT